MGRTRRARGGVPDLAGGPASRRHRPDRRHPAATSSRARRANRAPWRSTGRAPHCSTGAPRPAAARPRAADRHPHPAQHGTAADAHRGLGARPGVFAARFWSGGRLRRDQSAAGAVCAADAALQRRRTGLARAGRGADDRGGADTRPGCARPGGHGGARRRGPAAVRARHAGLRPAAVGRTRSRPALVAGHAGGLAPGLARSRPA